MGGGGVMPQGLNVNATLMEEKGRQCKQHKKKSYNTSLEDDVMTGFPDIHES